MVNLYGININLIENVKMLKKKYYILVGLLLFLIICYFLDKSIFMEKRVLRHNLWEHTTGEKIRGFLLVPKTSLFLKTIL